MPRNRAKERWKARFFTVNHLHLATFRRTTFYSATLGTMRPFLSIFSALALASQAAATQAPPPALVLASTAPGAPARTAAKQVRRCLFSVGAGGAQLRALTLAAAQTNHGTSRSLATCFVLPRQMRCTARPQRTYCNHFSPADAPPLYPLFSVPSAGNR